MSDYDSPSVQIQENVPLGPLTTLRVGGNARYFVRAETEQQVAGALEFADKNGLKLFVLGGGSNIVVSDAGFDGVVLQIAIGGQQSTYMGNIVMITVGAGVDWDAFVELCVSRNFAGLECLSGIPGSVGGTPVQNVGAYGQEVSESILGVRCFERGTGRIVELWNEECGFSYRTSIFNSTSRDRYVVLAVRFSLKIDAEPKIAYKDIVDFFAGQRPTLFEVREAVLSIRRSKSMVIDCDDPNSRSAGSFFKNPVVTKDTFQRIRTSFKNVPYFEFGEMVKIPAAWLIENAGFHKGFVMGRAGISTKHSLALINRDGATADEILALRLEIQTKVKEKFRIDLITEPVFVGF